MSNNSNDHTSDIHRELAEQGVEYLEGLDTVLYEIEQAILSLTDPRVDSENLNRIARVAHSIKGTAGIYKYDLITTICHSLEDRVTAIRLDSQSLDTQVDSLLRYVDAIGLAAQAYLRGDKAALDGIAHKLGLTGKSGISSTSETDRPKRRVLVIEKMGSLLQLVNAGLRSYDNADLEIAVSPNGYDGLGRLLREHFDCVVMSNLSELIRGDELVNVLASVSSPNQETPLVLLTSDHRLKVPDLGRKIFIVPKGADLTTRIRETMTALFGSRMQALPIAPHALKVRTVLLVDDSVPIQRLVQMVLKKSLNIQIQIASTGAEALAMLAKGCPDLAVLDFQLPDMDGVALANVIKKLHPNLPFIFLTAADSAEERARLAATGPRGIIKKPFPPMDLVKWMTDYSEDAA